MLQCLIKEKKERFFSYELDRNRRSDGPPKQSETFVFIHKYILRQNTPFTFLPFTSGIFKVCKAVNRYQYRYLYVRIAIKPPDSSHRHKLFYLYILQSYKAYQWMLPNSNYLAKLFSFFKKSWRCPQGFILIDLIC